MINRHPVRTGKVDRRRNSRQVHKRTIVISECESQQGSIRISQFKALTVSTEITGRIDNEVAQMFGVSHQFKEDRAGCCIHLELVSDMRRTFVGDQCGIEINIFGDTAKIIFGCCLHVSSDTESETPLTVGQQKTGNARFMETLILGFVQYPDNFITRLITGNKQD